MFSSLVCSSASTSETLKAYLVSLGWYLIGFNTEGSSTRDEIYRKMVAGLPLDPVIRGERVIWDALTDSFFEGIRRLGKRNVALVWMGVADLIEGDVLGFLMIAQLLHDLALAVADENVVVGPSIGFCTILLAEGKSFPLFDKSKFPSIAPDDSH